MGFLKRLLGLEVRPGEPEPLSDSNFSPQIEQSDLPVVIYFFHLWCGSCQVMGGLLNEIGPEYLERVKMFKMDVTKNPASANEFKVESVPAIVVLKDGKVLGRLTGLIPINKLREWLNEQIAAEETTPE